MWWLIKYMKAVCFLREHIQVLFFFSTLDTAYTHLSFIYSQTYRINRFKNADLFINEIYKWLFWAQITDEVRLEVLALPTFCGKGSGTLIPDNFCLYWWFPQYKTKAFLWMNNRPVQFIFNTVFFPQFSRLALTVTKYLSNTMCHNTWKNII